MTVRMVRQTTLKPEVPRGPRVVAVGFPRGKTPGLVISKAIWNEFGTRGGASGGGWGGPIPERPFLRNAMRDNQRKYARFSASKARDLVEGKITLEGVLKQLGVLAQGDVQHEITALREPPNSPVTIAAKGSSNPLIDTGEMRQSVTWQIRAER